MSWGPRRRKTWQRLVLRAFVLTGLLAITATLAVALQVRRVVVDGVRRFPVAEVTAVLQTALGSPTLTARPEALREAVCGLPWVAEAKVAVSLDGVISCAVVERQPVAIEMDGDRCFLLDAEGRILGPAESAAGSLVLEGYAAHPDERAAVLAEVMDIEARWGNRLERVLRLGPRDAVLFFHESRTMVIVDPGRPEGAALARRVLQAWVAARGAAPLRLDARVAGRVAVLPALEAGEES